MTLPGVRSDDRIGQLLDGKYRVEELLGRGGMGLVYGARHRATGRAVAIKVLRAELASERDLVQRLSTEARLAVEASHPNVVEVIDTGVDERGVPYLVLERLFGHTLEALLYRALPLLATTEALLPVMNALAVLHGAGIVHRDIKPSNVFLSRDSGGRITPKLLDFGIAKALASSRSTLSGSALGTPAYMAPEQALGWGALGPHADVWSMGVVLVHSLTGELPFELTAASHFGSLLSGLQKGDLPGVPEPVAAELARALRLEPQERFADMAEFRNALLGALRQVDASCTWPSEQSVSYARTTSELEGCLQALECGGAAGPGKVPGRDAHIATRTWRGATDWLSRHSRPRGLVTGVVLACSVLAVIALPGVVWWGRTPRPSALNETSTATNSSVPALEPQTTRELTPIERSPRAEPAPSSPSGHEREPPDETSPTVAGLGKRAKLAATPQGKASPTAPPDGARSGPARRNDAEPPTLPPERRRWTRGANRAPIID